jgi:hypothetical protein
MRCPWSRRSIEVLGRRKADPALGTNRRYSHVVDRQIDERILERLAATGELQTLTTAELQLDELPLTVDPRPKPVRAWVRFGENATRVDALALRWTPRAVGIQFDVAGRHLRTWVWASAVETFSN